MVASALASATPRILQHLIFPYFSQGHEITLPRRLLFALDYSYPSWSWKLHQLMVSLSRIALYMDVQSTTRKLNILVTTFNSSPKVSDNSIIPFGCAFSPSNQTKGVKLPISWSHADPIFVNVVNDNTSTKRPPSSKTLWTLRFAIISVTTKASLWGWCRARASALVNYNPSSRFFCYRIHPQPIRLVLRLSSAGFPFPVRVSFCWSPNYCLYLLVGSPSTSTTDPSWVASAPSCSTLASLHILSRNHSLLAPQSHL